MSDNFFTIGLTQLVRGRQRQLRGDGQYSQCVGARRTLKHVLVGISPSVLHIETATRELYGCVYERLFNQTKYNEIEDWYCRSVCSLHEIFQFSRKARRSSSRSDQCDYHSQSRKSSIALIHVLVGNIEKEERRHTEIAWFAILFVHSILNHRTYKPSDLHAIQFMYNLNTIILTQNWHKRSEKGMPVWHSM